MATGIQKLLFVDTNIWLDFYRAQNEAYIGLLDKVERIAPRIIVTHQLETEFKKNRQQVILKTVQLLQDHLPKKVPSVGVLAQAKQFKMVGAEIDSARSRINKLQTQLIAMLEKPTDKDKVFQAVHRVFHRDGPLVLTREQKDDEKRKAIRERAERRFMHGCPPRKANDTSYGDALNWEWMIDCAISKSAELVIVSRDADYGATHEGRSYINDHLRHEFSNRVSQKRELLLYTKLSDALKHFKVVVTQAQVEAEAELIDDEPNTSPADPGEFDIMQEHA
jgi:PIN domain